MTSSPQIVIGLGTGRCGTQSLAFLLDSQCEAEVYHEKHSYQIAWEGAEQRVDQLLRWCQSRADLRLVGDVGLYYLPYVEYILSRSPGVKFLCLKRDRAQTVRSYMEKTKRANHWMYHNRTRWKAHPWDHCYPKYAVSMKELAVGRFWDEYYTTAERLQEKYPESFRVFAMESLNASSGQQEVLSFLDIAKEERQLCVGVRLNQTPLPLPRRAVGWLSRIWSTRQTLGRSGRIRSG